MAQRPQWLFDIKMLSLPLARLDNKDIETVKHPRETVIGDSKELYRILILKDDFSIIWNSPSVFRIHTNRFSSLVSARAFYSYVQRRRDAKTS